jgi:hypothetical protein
LLTCAEAVRLWLSGGRSVHLKIPPRVYGGAEGHPRLPRIYGAMVNKLFPSTVAPTLDRAIYNLAKGRMWRLPNRQRRDTGRHKVPIAVAELLHTSVADLEHFTRVPRHGVFWPEDGEVSPCPGLVQIYEETRAAVGASVGTDARMGAATVADEDGLLSHLFRARGWLGNALPDGKWACYCPWADQHTKGTDGDSSTVLFPPSGRVLGWWHCSHAHCADRTLADLLALFSLEERLAAQRLIDQQTRAMEDRITRRAPPSERSAVWPLRPYMGYRGVRIAGGAHHG